MSYPYIVMSYPYIVVSYAYIVMSWSMYRTNSYVLYISGQFVPLKAYPISNYGPSLPWHRYFAPPRMVKSQWPQLRTNTRPLKRDFVKPIRKAIPVKQIKQNMYGTAYPVKYDAFHPVNYNKLQQTNYKRWGPKFVIIENNKPDTGNFVRPELDKNTKILQYNSGRPEETPGFSYSYKDYNSNPTSSVYQTMDTRQNDMGESKYVPTLSYRNLPKSSSHVVNAQDNYIPLTERPTDSFTYRGQVVTSNKLKNKPINSDRKRILNQPAERMENLATTFLEPLYYKRQRAPQNEDLNSNKASQIYKEVLEDEKGHTRQMMPINGKFTDQIRLLQPTLKQTQEVVDNLFTPADKRKYKMGLDQKIQALNNELITRYYNKHPELKPDEDQKIPVRSIEKGNGHQNESGAKVEQSVGGRLSSKGGHNNFKDSDSYTHSVTSRQKERKYDKEAEPKSNKLKAKIDASAGEEKKGKQHTRL